MPKTQERFKNALRIGSKATKAAVQGVMVMRTIFILAVLLALSIAACNGQQGNANNSTQASSTGEGAQASSAPGTQTQGNERSPATTPQQCKQTIPYQTLMSALPAKAGDYTAQGPEGTTLTWTNPANAQDTVKYSTVSEVLTSSNASVIVSVLDTCYVQYLSAGWSTRAAFNGTQGFLQQTTISSHPAWEQYDRESNTYALNVLVKDRVLVTVQGAEGASEADVKQVADAIDYNTIANAATT
jgi:hypothetical protein